MQNRSSVPSYLCTGYFRSEKRLNLELIHEAVPRIQNQISEYKKIRNLSPNKTHETFSEKSHIHTTHVHGNIIIWDVALHLLICNMFSFIGILELNLCITKS